jgi:ATP-dependent DNA helicase RecG
MATAEEERRLLEKRQWGSLPFDARGVRGASVAEIDLTRFQLEYLPVAVSPEALVENGRTVDQQLQALRLVQPDGTPTATSLLVLGLDPRRWFPGAYIQFLRVDGTALTDPIIDQREVAGTVIDQLRQIDELVHLNIARVATVGGTSRVERVEYPQEAIRQLVRNAVIHRTYEGTAAPTRVTWFSDRIEIQNPGGPYGSVTRTNFGTGVTDYRNPTLAAALKSLGFVERFGVGIAIARERLAANGNPTLEFDVQDEHVLVILRRTP